MHLNSSPFRKLRKCKSGKWDPHWLISIPLPFCAWGMNGDGPKGWNEEEEQGTPPPPRIAHGGIRGNYLGLSIHSHNNTHSALRERYTDTQFNSHHQTIKYTPVEVSKGPREWLAFLLKCPWLLLVVDYFLSIHSVPFDFPLCGTPCLLPTSTNWRWSLQIPRKFFQFKLIHSSVNVEQEQRKCLHSGWKSLTFCRMRMRGEESRSVSLLIGGIRSFELFLFCFSKKEMRLSILSLLHSSISLVWFNRLNCN